MYIITRIGLNRLNRLDFAYLST